MKAFARLAGPLIIGSLLTQVSATPPDEVASESFGFSLLPNSLTPNPRLVMTVFTEMTDHGRALPAASAEAPVYFVAHDQGRKSQGEAVGESVSPTPDALQETLFRSLAVNGYQPATVGRNPSLVLIYYWGSHHRMDPEQAELFPRLHQQRVLERAMLVGGSAYRKQIGHEVAFGHTFADRTPKKTFLIEQATGDMYFVVVSAYDHAELGAGRRRLAWRTTMTVGTAGVSMLDALPPLVATAGDYFGRETAEPVAIQRRVRRGTVKLGPLHVVGDPGRPAGPRD